MFACPSQSFTNARFAPASRRCVAIECFKQWNFRFPTSSPACCLNVSITLSAGCGENLRSICKKFILTLYRNGVGVSGCVNMLENWPCENVGCALGSRRCENAEVQDE